MCMVPQAILKSIDGVDMYMKMIMFTRKTDEEYM